VVERRKSASARGLGAWLAGAAPRSAHGEVTIAIVSDAQMGRLNSVYRHIDGPTDVLSFPEKRGSGFLGDIVIARGIARKQAQKLGHSLRLELRVLTLHGLLHLLGYDHQNDDGRMARTEARLRRKAGLPLGLIARSE
jgi:probable rRNA maturation factor